MTVSGSPASTAPQERSFASVAEQHLADVHSYLLYFTGDRAVAEELTAETFERACRHWRRYDPRRASAKTWLCQIARSTALDHFRAEDRRRRRETAYVRSEPVDTYEDAFGEGLSPRLEEALRSLSAGEREVIALRVILDIEVEGAARLLGISRTACTTRLHRALARLEAKVGDDVVA
ncbi:MAG: sigma-70 family RNA polymerase sigma factor [Actinobacteria bacterium]|nr:sigma-70 family RNA polymerase sigma factor [Actinomycetota bacterium]